MVTSQPWCLYLSPDTRAWRLSRLMAVVVKTDMPYKVKLIAWCSWCKVAVSFHYDLAYIKQRTAPSGWIISPTQRSVTAWQRNRSFVGGRREIPLWRDTRIRALPTDATIDRKMFKAAATTSKPLVTMSICLFGLSLVRLPFVKFVCKARSVLYVKTNFLLSVERACAFCFTEWIREEIIRNGV